MLAIQKVRGNLSIHLSFPEAAAAAIEMDEALRRREKALTLFWAFERALHVHCTTLRQFGFFFAAVAAAVDAILETTDFIDDVVHHYTHTHTRRDEDVLLFVFVFFFLMLSSKDC